MPRVAGGVGPLPFSQAACEVRIAEITRIEAEALGLGWDHVSLLKTPKKLKSLEFWDSPP